jgi:hypothetical protein
LTFEQVANAGWFAAEGRIRPGAKLSDVALQGGKKLASWNF